MYNYSFLCKIVSQIFFNVYFQFLIFYNLNFTIITLENIISIDIYLAPQFVIDPDLVFLIFLPPILFEAPWYTSWKDFWKLKKTIFSMAIWF